MEPGRWWDVCPPDAYAALRSRRPRAALQLSTTSADANDRVAMPLVHSHECLTVKRSWLRELAVGSTEVNPEDTQLPTCRQPSVVVNNKKRHNMTSKIHLRGMAGAILICGTFALTGTAYAKQMAVGKNEITEAFAKTQIIDDDYTNVTNLKRTSAGWTANADESGKPVSLLVTNMGDVVKQ